MKATALLAFVVIALAQPNTAQAQSQVRARTYPDVYGQTPVTGFVFGMTPSPGNAYNYTYVISIVSGSAADKAGLMVGDTIVAVDGRDVLTSDYFPVKIAGTRYVMRVRRGSEEIELVYIYPQIAEVPLRDSPAAASPP